jgi:glucose/arabinose dehydrogenase
MVLGCCWLLPERYAVNAPLGQLLLGRGRDALPPDELRAQLQAPPEFTVELYVDGIANARWLRFTPAGDLLVSAPRSGRVLLVERDADGDGRPEAVRTLLEGLDRPHGLDLRDGWLYVGETGAIARVRFEPDARRVVGAVERVGPRLPEGGNHWTRTVRRRSSRPACATAWASTGSPRPATSTRRTTGATCSATASRPAS